MAFETFHCYPSIPHHPHFCTSQTGATSEADQTNNPQTGERTVRQIRPRRLMSEADTQTGETIYRNQLTSEASSQTGVTKTNLRTSVRHLATRLNLQLRYPRDLMS